MRPFTTTIILLLSIIHLSYSQTNYSEPNWDIDTYRSHTYSTLAFDKNPIVGPELMKASGATGKIDNIMFPCVVKLPDWLKKNERAHPSAKYYLYFSAHIGTWIRMAWTDDLDSGRWHIFNPTNNGTSYINNKPVVGRGVLDMDINSPHTIELGEDFIIGGKRVPHISSPHVEVDDINKRFILYFHGRTNAHTTRNEQGSFVAFSSHGLNFNNEIDGGEKGFGILPVFLAEEAYLRPFTCENRLLAIGNFGYFFEAPDANNPFHIPARHHPKDALWKRLPVNPFDKHYRKLPNDANSEVFTKHHTVRLLDDEHTLEIFSSRKVEKGQHGHKPISRTTINLQQDESRWEASYPPELIIVPNDSTYEVRDPFIFEENNKLYLFYSNGNAIKPGGEKGISMTILEKLHSK